MVKRTNCFYKFRLTRHPLQIVIFARNLWRNNYKNKDLHWETRKGWRPIGSGTAGNCRMSSRRAFSEWQMIETYLRSTILTSSRDRLSDSLAVNAIKNECAKQLHIDELIYTQFCTHNKARILKLYRTNLVCCMHLMIFNETILIIDCVTRKYFQQRLGQPK